MAVPAPAAHRSPFSSTPASRRSAWDSRKPRRGRSSPWSICSRGRSAKGTPGDGAAAGVLLSGPPPARRPAGGSPSNETPDPLPDRRIKAAGYPIHGDLSAARSMPAAQAWLEDETSKDVPAWVSTPTRPANERLRPLAAVNTPLPLRPRGAPAGNAAHVVHVQAAAGNADWCAHVELSLPVSPSEVHIQADTSGQPRGSMSPARRLASRRSASIRRGRRPAWRMRRTWPATSTTRRTSMFTRSDPTCPAYRKPEVRPRSGLSVVRIGGVEVNSTDAIRLDDGLGAQSQPRAQPDLEGGRVRGGAAHLARLALGNRHADRTGGARRAAGDPVPGSRTRPNVPLYFGREVGSPGGGSAEGRPAAGFAVTAGFFPGAASDEGQGDSGGRGGTHCGGLLASRRLRRAAGARAATTRSSSYPRSRWRPLRSTRPRSAPLWAKANHGRGRGDSRPPTRIATGRTWRGRCSTASTGCAG